MTFAESVRIRRKWRRWLKAIGRDLGSLLISYDVFTVIQAAFRENKSIRRPTLVCRWITGNYASRVSIGIRRLTDRHKKSISLYRLIEDIANHPDVITRKYFIAGYTRGCLGEERADEAELASYDYDTFADQGCAKLNVQNLSRDLERLQEEVCRIVRFADKWIAHHDTKRKGFWIPRYGHVGKALKHLDEIYCKYALLLNGEGLTTCKPILPYDWMKPLRHPWIERPCRRE